MIELIKDKRFKSVVSFLISYRFIMQLLIIPLSLSLGRTLMNYHQVQFMTTDKMLYLLTKPSVWIFLIVGFGVLLFFLIFELSSVILLSEYEELEHSLAPISLNKIKWTLKAQNIIFLPFLLLVILGFHFGMNSMITDQFFIPEFIYDTIVKTPSYFFIYTAISIVAFVVGFHLVFLFHHLFLGKRNFKEASIQSLQMVNGNRLNFLVAALKMGLKVTLASGVFHFGLLFIAFLILFLFPPFFKLNAVSLSILFVVNKMLLFLVVSGIAAVNVLFLTKKYREYGGVVEDRNALIGKKEIPQAKYVLLVLMVVSFTAQGYGAYQTTMTFEQVDYLEEKIYVTSHRGNSSVAPENTIAAIQAAKEERADVAEIDVQLTKDGHVVVIHDYSLSRLAHSPRKVVDLTLAELKELEVGSWFAEEFRGEQIPTLEEVIDEAGNTLKLNIELKPTKDEAELAQAVVEILAEMAYEERAIISSLNKQALKEVKKINPEIDVGYIVPVAIGRFDFEEEIDFYSLEMSFLTRDLVEKIKNQDKEVHAWTVNSEEDLKRMQKLQVDHVITDYPMLANKVLATNVWERGILEILTFLE